MRKFKITIDIMPIDSVLDPQGEAIELILKNNPNYQANNFRVGKKIEFTLESNNNSTAKNTVKDLCEKFLVNEIIEKYKIKIENAKN
ncbi:MAG: phosphoribosylformylglycinamidine synthase subunit PurS [Thermodesulfobacteriota bacterium]|nr:phosphoribosylformylglycinamidine synthase subunit PurS [Deltaproteobacteria bacterium TMED58]RZP15861.1 MAG: phosphoribosylformylglycinamidine synthase, purS protein [Candidatus Dadabacteria bacterium]|tara:strand:+ start:2142 stop:2402 length:261 start_codon:yes stop_codon:yes gene_type:complete